MDIFEKCERFTIADELREQGIYPYFHALETKQDVEVVMEGKRRIMLGSNNYLGLTTEPSIIEAGIKALEQYGTGCSGSRFLNGTLSMHLELERELADFVHTDEAITFSTGFQSNLGIISATMWYATVRTTPASTTAASSATAPWCAISTTTWPISKRPCRRSPRQRAY